MNTATFVRLIFVKDLRALRIHLLLMLALWSAMIATLSTSTLGMNINSLAPLLLAYLLLPAGAYLITVRLGLSDPTGREFRFLLTRPVPGSAVGFAKALFLTLLLIIPYFLGVEAMIAAIHVPLDLTDHILLLIETVAWLGGACAGVMLLCAFFQKGLSVFIAVILFILAAIFISSWPHQDSLLGPEEKRLTLFRTVLSEVLFFGMALIALGWRYHAKSFRVPLAISMGAIGMFCLASLFPYNLAEGLQDQSGNADRLTLEQLGRIHLTLDRSVGLQSPYMLNGGMSPAGKFVMLNQSVKTDGLEPHYFIQTDGYHAVVTLRSGKKIISNYFDTNVHGGVGGPSAALMQIVAGLRPQRPSEEGNYVLDLLNLKAKDIGGDDPTGATVKGYITLDVRRAFVVRTLPLKSGASVDAIRSRYELSQVTFSEDSVELNMNCFTVPLSLRGDLYGWDMRNKFSWLIVYRPYHEALQMSELGSNVNGSFGIYFFGQHQKFVFPSLGEDPAWQAPRSDWEKSTDIVFIGSESCGHVTLRYEIDNVDLSRGF